MKKLIKITSGVALMFMLVFTLSSFSSNTEVEEDNNGTIVEVIKGQQWNYYACGEVVSTTKTTRQFKNGEVHMITLVFQLPDGHCSIPERGANKYESGPWTINVTPSGTMIAKQVNN